jgi:uncharacterized protein DUF5677
MPRHLGTSRVLKEIRRLERFLNNLKMIPATRRYRNVVILGLLSKALTVGRAICTLTDSGFPAEAFAMSRTLIEIYFCLRYIGNKDTEKRAETYVKYHARVRKEWQTIIMKYYPHISPASITLEEEVLETADEYKSKAHWTKHGGQARFMAFEEDTTEVDEHGHPITSEFDYDVIYFWTSHYVHVTVVGIEAHASTPGEVFKVRARTWADKGRKGDALFNTLVFISKSFVVAFRTMNEEQPEAILQEIHKQIKKFARGGTP